MAQREIEYDAHQTFCKPLSLKTFSDVINYRDWARKKTFDLRTHGYIMPEAPLIIQNLEFEMLNERNWMRTLMLVKTEYDEYDIQRIERYLPKDKHIAYDHCHADGINYLAYKKNETLVPPNFPHKTPIATPTKFIEEDAKQIAETVRTFSKTSSPDGRIETIYVSYKAPDKEKLGEYMKNAGKCVEALAKELGKNGVVVEISREKMEEYMIDKDVIKKATEGYLEPVMSRVQIVPCLDIMDFYKLERFVNKENWTSVKDAFSGKAQNAYGHPFGRLNANADIHRVLKATNYEDFKEGLWEIVKAKYASDEEKVIWFPNYDDYPDVRKMYAGGNAGEVYYKSGYPDENIMRYTRLQDELEPTDRKEGVISGHWTSEENLDDIRVGEDRAKTIHATAVRLDGRKMDILSMLEDRGDAVRIDAQKDQIRYFEPITIIRLDPAITTEFNPNPKKYIGEDDKRDSGKGEDDFRKYIEIVPEKEKISAKIFYDDSYEVREKFMPKVINGVRDLQEYLNKNGSEIAVLSMSRAFMTAQADDPFNYDKMFDEYADNLLGRKPTGKKEEFVMVLGDMAATDQNVVLSKETIEKMQKARKKLAAEGTMLRIYYIAAAPEKFDYAGKSRMETKPPRDVMPQFQILRDMLTLEGRNWSFNEYDDVNHMMKKQENYGGKIIISSNGNDKIVWLQKFINTPELFEEYKRIIGLQLEEMKRAKF